MLRRLAEARLVVLGNGVADGEPHAELAHETLISAWRRLRELVTENAEFLRWLGWVQQRAADGEDLLSEARIAEARRWFGTRLSDIPDAVRRFVQSSETAAEARLREQHDADRAEALRLAGDAELALHTAHPATVVALALGLESLLTQPTVQGDDVLRRVLRLHPLTLARLDHDSAVNAVAFSPDATRVATGSADGSARVFDAETRAEVARFDHDSAVNAVAFSPDATRVATGSADGSARVFDAATGPLIQRALYVIWCFALLGLQGHQFRACFLNGNHAGARGDGAV